MVMIGKVLRMHHRDNKSVREIARATSLSRNTVRKYLRRGKAETPLYRRPLVPSSSAPMSSSCLRRCKPMRAGRRKSVARAGRCLSSCRLLVTRAATHV